VIQALINVAAGSENPQRDQALLMFLSNTGVRLGELCALQPADVDLNSCSAIVTGKGDQERWVFYSEETHKALEAWLAVRPSSAANLFNLGYYGVGELLRRLAERAHITGVRVHPHAFRKTAATRFAEELDPHTLMQLFGWKQLKTSESYVYHSRARLAQRARAVLQRGG
jgi:integrase/recombinase XerD